MTVTHPPWPTLPVPSVAPAVAAEPPAPRRVPVRTLGVVAAVAALNVLVLAGPSALRALVGFPVTVLVPGGLLLVVLGGRQRRGWDLLLHAVALSLAVLIPVAAVLALLPGGRVTTGASLVAFDVVVTVLGAAAWWRRVPAEPRRRFRVRPHLDLGMVAAAVGVSAGVNAVALAVFGARQLNTGGGPAPAIAALAAGVVAFVAAVVAARAGRSTAAATVIYLLGAAVLLATSLRGVGVTGHDIKIEYRVLLDTLESGSWVPGGPFPGYNSCLSLTVLPAMLAKLLGLSALDVFRVCFQLIFATVPVGAFLVARRLMPPGYAMLSGGLFVAFPTFVNDMPMLNRQEIALLFFTVGLLALLGTGGPAWRRGVLITIAAAGMTVSHYSSAAVAAALLAVAWLIRGGRVAVARRRGVGRTPAPALWPAAVTLIVMVVGWAALTGSATAFVGDLTATARAIGGKATVLSDSTRYSPVRAGAALDDTTALRAYTERVAVQRADDGVRPAPASCTTTVLPADALPPTALGRATTAVGLSPDTLNTRIRHGFVLLFELGAVVGCVLLWWRRAVPAPQTTLMAELSTAGVVLLAAAVAVPQLTDSYGLLRIYQQLLPVLGIAVVVTMVTVVHAAGRFAARRGLPAPRSTVAVVATVVVAACLITTSGLLPRLLGGYPPQLNLADAGPYFRGYLAEPDDVAAARWIRDNLPADAWVVADSRDTANLRSLTTLNPDEGIVPGSIPSQAYLMTTVDGTDAIATAVVGDRIIRYVIPLACLADQRSVVHAAGPHVLYAPYGR
jgi:uncharacterized membrane protein